MDLENELMFAKGKSYRIREEGAEDRVGIKGIHSAGRQCDVRGAESSSIHTISKSLRGSELWPMILSLLFIQESIWWTLGSLKVAWVSVPYNHMLPITLGILSSLQVTFRRQHWTVSALFPHKGAANHAVVFSCEHIRGFNRSLSRGCQLAYLPPWNSLFP